MERKTKLDAPAGKPELLILRDFDLPIDLLFRAYTEADIVEEWMGNKVLRLDNFPQGAWRFEATDPKGNVHKFNGTIHEFVPESKITRTFEMEGAGVGIQLEFIEFEALTEDTSRLRMHIVYRSVEHRDKMIQFGMDWGMNAAHNRLEKTAIRFKAI